MVSLLTKVSTPTAPTNGRKLGYLSGAPRVSTRMESEASGPRAHVLGVIGAFESLGWTVNRYIIGDRLPARITHQSEQKLESSVFIRFGADLIRLMIGCYHTLRAWQELHRDVEWVYERFAILQSLGWIFRRAKIPWILETSGIFYYEAKVERKSIVLSGVAQTLEMWAYRNCDVLVCVTDALKNLIVELTGISPEKVLVVPNGVDVDFFDPAKHYPRRTFEGPTIGFVGSLVRWHRLDILLNALADLKNEGIVFNLVVVGDGPMQKAWKQHAHERGIDNMVCFAGRLSWTEVPDHILGFDIGYMGNSQLDLGVMYHSPLKLYEYLAMARPVVASAYADSQNIVVPGETGYLFQPGELEDLKRILRLAFSERSHWQEMGKAARTRVITTASWQARVKEMIAGIERILEQQNAHPSAGN